MIAHEDRDVAVCHSSKTPENVAPMMRKPNHKPPRNDQNFSKYGQGSGSYLVVVILSSCERESWNEPKRVEGLDQVKVQAAFASGVISAAIGDDGSLWASLGWGHALAQTKDGKLFGWGYSADARLGQMRKPLESSHLDSSSDIPKATELSKLSSSVLEAAEKLVLEGMEKEKDMPIVWEPCLVKELCHFGVVDVACGLDHSLVLCRDGTLLSSGSNIYGQLGRVIQDLGMLPVGISFHPVSVASRLRPFLAICQIASSEGMGDTTGIVSWGWNQSSQLGREGYENLLLVVEELVGETPVSVSGGRAHSVALTSKREVWVWGSGRNGRLGLGSSIGEDEPKLVEYLEGSEVLQAVSGFDHNLVLVSE
ncbi:putative E3 ubiquitin-protein ligase HERC4 [Camellia lanceoleosa]|nr:putative E3 ubiquitin-protein ligase HERC4 [Camellia lanceoleosa]